MGLERTRTYLLKMHRVEETLQWDQLVYRVLDKSVGGKMFATMNPEHDGLYVVRFAAAAERLGELLEIEGVVPAPYLARAGWVAVESWSTLPEAELHEHLRLAYERVEAKLPRRVQRVLELNTAEYRALVRESRAAEKSGTSPKRTTKTKRSTR